MSKTSKGKDRIRMKALSASPKTAKSITSQIFDARWTVKRGKFPCGYKVHVNADERG